MVKLASMVMRRILYVFLLFSIVFSCGNNENSASKENSNERQAVNENYEASDSENDAESKTQPKATRGLQGLSPEEAEWKQKNMTVLMNFQQGNYEETIPLAESVLEMAEEYFGPVHINVAASLNNLAMLYRNTGRYKDADSMFIRSIRIKEELLGKDHYEVAKLCSNLGVSYYRQKEYEKAESLFVRSIDVARKHTGNNPRISQTIMRLAKTYEDAGKYGKAEETYLEALSLAESGWDSDHVVLQDMLREVAAFYRKQGHAEKAREYEKRLN